VLDPIGVRRVEGEISGIDTARQQVSVLRQGEPSTLAYDRLILALGSELARLEGPELATRAFDVDTYPAALRLSAHLHQLPSRPDVPGRFTALVVGSGATGVELAAELPQRLREKAAACGAESAVRVILLDRGPRLFPGMGEAARTVIEGALASLGVEVLLGREIVAFTEAGVRLNSGEDLPAATVVWCAGMRASPLAAHLPCPTDALGRLATDAFLRVQGLPHCFAPGDMGWADTGDGQATVMSCQHSRQTGRYAGHNAVCDLIGVPMLPLQLAPYVTVVDLGPAGAVYTEGWERRLVASGEAAKQTKQTINRQRIYPPLSGQREAILAAGAIAPVQPPAIHRS
jgi:NADH dehydrogenase